MKIFLLCIAITMVLSGCNCGRAGRYEIVPCDRKQQVETTGPVNAYTCMLDTKTGNFYRILNAGAPLPPTKWIKIAEIEEVQAH